MIHYDESSWLDILLRWKGTVLPQVGLQVTLFFLYVGSAYAAERHWNVNIGSPEVLKHSNLLGHALAFLLVFRANQSYSRYNEGQLLCVRFFANLRDFNILAATLFRGGRGQLEWNRRWGQDGFSMERKRCFDDSDDKQASRLRFELARWSLALAISMRINMRLCGDGYLWGSINEDTKRRLNWERMRLRTLMSQEEFEAIDRSLRVEDMDDEEEVLWATGRSRPEVFHDGYASAPPRSYNATGEGGVRASSTEREEFVVSMEPRFQQTLVIFFRITQLIRSYVTEPWSYRERFSTKFISMSVQLMEVRDSVQQAMTTPLPLPYVNLVRTLLVVYLASAPFFMSSDDGFWANVGVPTVTALALFGIERIGSELENPFGNGINDIDVQDLISRLEMELMRMLEMVGDAEARQRFTWLPVPLYMQEETSRPFGRYLAVARELSHHQPPKRPAGAAHSASAGRTAAACAQHGGDGGRRRGAFEGGVCIRRTLLTETSGTTAGA